MKKQRMEVAKRVPVEPDFFRVLRQHFNRRLVVENHLSLLRVFSLDHLSALQQALGIKQGIGVALQAARVPRQVDQQAVQHLPEIGSRRLVLFLHLPQRSQFHTDFAGHIGGLIGFVELQQICLVSHRTSGCNGSAHMPSDLPSRYGKIGK